MPKDVSFGNCGSYKKTQIGWEIRGGRRDKPMDREGLRPLTSKPAGMAVEHQQTRENNWIFPCPMPRREVNCGLSHRSPWRVPIWGGFGFGGAGSGCLAAPRYKWLFLGRLRFSPLWALLKEEGVDCPPPTNQPACWGSGLGAQRQVGAVTPTPSTPRSFPVPP